MKKELLTSKTMIGVYITVIGVVLQAFGNENGIALITIGASFSAYGKAVTKGPTTHIAGKEL